MRFYHGIFLFFRHVKICASGVPWRRLSPDLVLDSHSGGPENGAHRVIAVRENRLATARRRQLRVDPQSLTAGGGNRLGRAANDGKRPNTIGIADRAAGVGLADLESSVHFHSPASWFVALVTNMIITRFVLYARVIGKISPGFSEIIFRGITLVIATEVATIAA